MPNVRTLAARDAYVVLVHKMVHAVHLVVEGKVGVILRTREVLDVKHGPAFRILRWATLIIARATWRCLAILPALGYRTIHREQSNHCNNNFERYRHLPNSYCGIRMDFFKGPLGLQCNECVLT
jgi:hypothetical protein